MSDVSVEHAVRKSNRYRPPTGGELTSQYQALVDAVSGLLGVPGVLEDREFNLIAYVTQAGPLDTVRTESILRRRCSADARTWLLGRGIGASQRATRTGGNPSLGLTPRLCIPARHDGVTYGYFWFLDTETDDATLREAEQIAMRAGEQLAMDQRLGRRVEDALRALISPQASASPTRANEFAHAASIATDGTTLVMKLRFPNPTLADRFVARPKASPATWLATVDEGDVAVLARGAALASVQGRQLVVSRVAKTAAALLPSDLERKDTMLFGVGGVVSSLVEAGTSWHQAGMAINSGPPPSDQAGIADWNTLGVRRLLGLVDRKALREALAVPQLEDLIADPKGDVLVETAVAYLDSGASAKTAALRLNIHRQTLYYRLAALEDRTGLRISDGHDRLLLHLTITLFHDAKAGCD